MMLMYIDPGTGSMLFAAIMGLVSTFFFLIRKLWISFKYLANGGHTEKKDASKHTLVIFNEGKQYWTIFEPICDELEKRGIECEYYVADEEDLGLKKNYKYVHCNFIGSGNKAFAHMNLLNAKVCMATTPGLGVYQWKRSKEVEKYVHIFHSLSGGTGYRMFGLDEYDVVFLTGPLAGEYIRQLEALRSEAPKRLEIVGSTYMDRILSKKKNYIEDMRIENQKGKNHKTVLLAPSWGKSSIFAKFGDKVIEALLRTDYDIIVRPHPQSLKVEKEMVESIIKKYENNQRIVWDIMPDNFQSLMSADILISDFSSVIFDFALGFDKPVIYADTEFDISVYDAAWLNGPSWQFLLLPDIGIMLEEKDFEQMQEKLDDLLKNEKYQEGRERVREKIWHYKGSAAVRTVDILEQLLKDEGKQVKTSVEKDGLIK